MRSFSEMVELVDGVVFVRPRHFGDEWWARLAGRGWTVWRFDDPAEVAAYASLHEEAHWWVHRDYDHGAWHVLDVEVPSEVGRDYVEVRQRDGAGFAGAPGERVRLLGEVAGKLVDEAPGEIDRFLAGLVRERVRGLRPGLRYVPDEQRFYVGDLEPGAAELAAWRAITGSATALAGLTLYWEHTGDGVVPYRTSVGGHALVVRVSDFPAEPLYTLIVDGESVADLDDWPEPWGKPDPPQHLLDLVAPAGPAVTAELLRSWAERICGLSPDDLAAPAGFIAVLGIPGAVVPRSNAVTVEPPIPGTRQVQVVLRDGRIHHLDLELDGARITRADLDARLGPGRELPRVDALARHDVAYRVDVAGAPSGCEIDGWFDEPPTDDGPAAQISLRPVRAP